jgi:hypothetical protein
MITIIPCGARKLPYKTQAQEMYIGSYAIMCRRYAKKLGYPFFILSAKYGLLYPTDIIEPYSLTLGQVGSITPKEVKLQAISLGIINESCIAIGGKRYTDLCKAIFSNCQTPLQNIKGGNGKQLQWMKAQL